MKIGNRSSENMAQFKYLGMTATNRNLIPEEIRRRMNFGNACYHSVQTFHNNLRHDSLGPGQDLNQNPAI
jgi:hypothetical protein